MCIGGKCICVFLHTCLRGCMWILKGCWPLEGSHLFDIVVFMLFSHLSKVSLFWCCGFVHYFLKLDKY